MLNRRQYEKSLRERGGNLCYSCYPYAASDGATASPIMGTCGGPESAWVFGASVDKNLPNVNYGAGHRKWRIGISFSAVERTTKAAIDF